MDKLDLSYLALKWPSAIVARDEVKIFTGGTMSSKYLANLDSKKQGPPGRFRCGRKICYPVDQFVKWLESRSKTVE
jgi:hypothetical protein